MTLAFFATQAFGLSEIEKYPKNVSSDCRGGVANIYDECSDQMQHVDMAIVSDKKTGKRVLVVYGSEWCIWCHVFDEYIAGKHTLFFYSWQYDDESQKWLMYESDNATAKQDAEALNQYV